MTERMIELTIFRKPKASFHIYFKTIRDARAFAEFEQELIEKVKKKTLETAKP